MPRPQAAPDFPAGLLQGLFAGTDNLVVVTDTRGQVQYTNFGGERPYPSTPDTLSGLLFAPCAQLPEAQHQVLADGQPVHLEVPGQREDSWLLLTISPLRSGAAITGLLHTGLDITARRQEEVRLRHIEELMVDTEGIAHFGIWEWDITQPHAHWTAGLYKIYGLTPETYVPSYEEYLKRVHPEDRERVIAATNGAFHQHQSYSHDERIFHTDGSVRYLHTWATPVLSADGSLARLMGICLDITERKLAEIAVSEHAAKLSMLNQELEQRVETRTRELSLAKTSAEDANASKSLFLATMSHEVRTPMNGVLGMLELLMGDSLTVEQRHMLTTVRDSSEALMGILDDILDFSKIEAGRMDLENIPVNLRRVVEGVADTLTANAQQRQLQLHCYVDPALPEWLLGDEVRLRQILLNLGSNAIKFTQTTPRQTGIAQLRAERIAGPAGRIGVQLEVVDNGIGMDAQTRATLFTPFTQADSSTTRRFGGTGLGLSICKRLVELMGGEISVDSWPGHGSSFRVRLALASGRGLPLLDTSLVQGLRVLALAPADPLQHELHSYISAAGGSLETCADPAAFEAAVAAAADDAGHPLVLLLRQEQHQDTAAWLAQLRMQARSGLQLVLLTSRQRAPLPAPPAGIVRVWLYPLHYQDLLNGLAAAAGRAHAIVATAPVHLAPALPTDARPVVLVAEDNRINQEIIRRQLEHLGYRYLITDNGRQALALWRTQPVDLLLTDCQMPEMDGFSLVRAIRVGESGGGRRLPVIALTANVLAGETDRCLAAGMDDYLSKPLRLVNLRRALERWLGKGGAAAGSPVAPDAEKNGFL